ncbi:MAG TPA: 23S rRNA (adenine(2030)-N(6))-methyltransferase RlmJ [Steroidobacteraceae bacterium]|nr:23S rRNA (adenine(2030)-N(6))-methyltransferase RlmJ [Steroidobacteraceae bacterium]
MKYRHSYHAGNFADVHKHVTLLALLALLKRKEKAFAYLETHAGRGVYDLAHAAKEAAGGADAFADGHYQSEELRHYADRLAEFRSSRHRPRAYPGSPLLAAQELRPQDRAILCELLAAEAHRLERELEGNPRCRVEQGDGFERLRAWLPPPERRGLILIDPPYEDSKRDFERVTAAVSDALRRFSTAIIAAWYPIKDERDTRHWQQAFARAVAAETLVSELWLYPRDSQVALNGSGLLIVNPPWPLQERMQAWLPELQARLDAGHAGGTSVTKLTRPA